jgi:hypothetical protein
VDQLGTCLVFSRDKHQPPQSEDARRKQITMRSKLTCRRFPCRIANHNSGKGVEGRKILVIFLQFRIDVGSHSCTEIMEVNDLEFGSEFYSIDTLQAHDGEVCRNGNLHSKATSI